MNHVYAGWAKIRDFASVDIAISSRTEKCLVGETVIVSVPSDLYDWYIGTLVVYSYGILSLFSSSLSLPFLLCFVEYLVVLKNLNIPNQQKKQFMRPVSVLLII